MGGGGRKRPRPLFGGDPARTLPITLRPASELGESFAGYADRLASHLNVPLISLLYRVGVVSEERFSALPVGYGLALRPETLRTFAGATRLPEEAVSATLLARYDGVCCDLSGLDPASPRTFSRVALGTWAYFVGSHACPSCLAHDGVWRLRWKVPWSFACVEHRRLLADTCPGCGRRIGVGRRDGRSGPAFPSLVPIPKACRNALPKGLAAAGRSSRPCGHPLDAIEAPEIDCPRVTEAQRRLDAALAGEEVSVAGEGVTSLEYFDDLRSICALVLSVGEAGDLGTTPSFVRRAFDDHVRERQSVHERRKELVEAGGDWRAGPRSRPFTGPPESAALMAAVAPVAVEVLSTGSPEELAARIAPFVERVRRSAERSRTSRRFAYFGFSPRLEAAFDRCWRPYRKVSFRIRADAKRFATEYVPDLSGLTTDHVPQLFWKEPFWASLAELLPGVLPDHARRVCSMWLAKVLTGATWEEAAREIGLPAGRGRGIANKVVSLLNSSGNTQEFSARILEIASRVAEDPMRVDYGRRRRALASLADLPFEEWEAVCRSAGARPGYRGGKSRYAATWLWGRLTGGDPKLAPGLHDKGASAGDLYRRFLKEDLLPNEALKEHLERYGFSLLARSKSQRRA